MAKIKKTGRHTGALKALRQSLRRRTRNKAKKETLKNLYKSLETALKAKDNNKVQGLLTETYSTLDRAAKTGVFHWKTVARRKSRVARQVNKLVTLSAASAAPPPEQNPAQSEKP